jgi:hypothetical protein
MVYSCKYDESGKILILMKGGSLDSVSFLRSSYIGRLEGGEIKLKFGLVTEFPKELPGDTRPYIHQYLRVVEDHENGTVRIGYETKP